MTYYDDLMSVTFVNNTILSKGKNLDLAVFCIIAVKNDIGLNKYAIHKDFGVIKSFAQSIS